MKKSIKSVALCGVLLFSATCSYAASSSNTVTSIIFTPSSSNSSIVTYVAKNKSGKTIKSGPVSSEYMKKLTSALTSKATCLLQPTGLLQSTGKKFVCTQPEMLGRSVDADNSDTEGLEGIAGDIAGEIVDG